MICLSPGGPMVYLSTTPSAEMLVGTSDGVVRCAGRVPVMARRRKRSTASM